MSLADVQRQRFADRMRATEPGAILSRRNVQWTITRCVRRDFSVELSLRSGRRTFQVSVPLCHTGPSWFDVDMRPVSPAPRQLALLV